MNGNVGIPVKTKLKKVLNKIKKRLEKMVLIITRQVIKVFLLGRVETLNQIIGL